MLKIIPIFILSIWMILFSPILNMIDSDTLMLPLMSILKPTFFYWEQNRFGTPLPFLAFFIKNPWWNLWFQNLLVIIFCISSFVLLPFLLSEDSKLNNKHVAIGISSYALFYFLSPEILFYEFHFLKYPNTCAFFFALSSLVVFIKLQECRFKYFLLFSLIFLSTWLNPMSFFIEIGFAILSRKLTKNFFLICLFNFLLIYTIMTFYPYQAEGTTSFLPFSDLPKAVFDEFKIFFSQLNLSAAVFLLAIPFFRFKNSSLVFSLLGACLIQTLIYAAGKYTSGTLRYLHPLNFVIISLPSYYIFKFIFSRFDSLVITLILTLILGPIMFGFKPNQGRKNLHNQYDSLLSEIKGANALSGSYWDVWMLYFANLDNGNNNLHPLTYRSVPIMSTWRYNDCELKIAQLKRASSLGWTNSWLDKETDIKPQLISQTQNFNVFQKKCD